MYYGGGYGGGGGGGYLIGQGIRNLSGSKSSPGYKQGLGSFEQDLTGSLAAQGAAYGGAGAIGGFGQGGATNMNTGIPGIMGLFGGGQKAQPAPAMPAPVQTLPQPQQTPVNTMSSPVTPTPSLSTQATQQQLMQMLLGGAR